MESDDELITEHLNGNETAFPKLLERHLPAIYTFVVRMGGTTESEDIVQEIFFKVWLHLPRFQKEQASFKTWVMRIARNTTIDFLRKRKSITISSLTEGPETLLEQLPDDELRPDELFALARSKELLDAAIKELPPASREVILLRYEEGLQFEEIAKILNESINTIKSRHRRALISLSKILARHQNDL